MAAAGTIVALVASGAATSVGVGAPAPVWINDEQYFAGVPNAAWEFHIGGYQVCEKWLKDRKGRKLSHDELVHYQSVVANLAETIRLMGEVDAAIPGWPLPSAEPDARLVAEAPDESYRGERAKGKRRR